MSWKLPGVPNSMRPTVRHDVIRLLESLDFDAVIVCGGDGTLTAARCLANESNVKIVGIPATIDDELPVTEAALGRRYGPEYPDPPGGTLRESVGGYTGIMVLEVMGRTNGELARLAALALGAAIVVTPEQGSLRRDRITDIADASNERYSPVSASRSCWWRRALDLINHCPSRAIHIRLCGWHKNLGARFRRHGSSVSNLDVRASVPGHLLRAAAPSAADRVLAVRFADAAWKAVTSPNEPSGYWACARE